MDNARRFKPAVILLDIKLGIEDGLRLLPMLRTANLSTPCVALTAHAGPHDGFKAHELGVVSLIEKPSSPDEIAAALRHASGLLDGAGEDRGERTEAVAAALSVIGLNFKSRGLSVAIVAAEIGVSAGHLSRTFRREIGRSIVSEIHQRRIGHAAHLLMTTTLRVKQIADQCGYHSSSELHRHFTTRVGRAPRAFRETVGKINLDNKFTEMDN